MKEYKLIKKYPGSPLVGTIAKNVGIRYNFINAGSCVDYTKSLQEIEEIQNSPEYWAEYVLTTEDGFKKYMGDVTYSVNFDNNKWIIGNYGKFFVLSEYSIILKDAIKYFHNFDNVLKFIEEINLKPKIVGIAENKKEIFEKDLIWLVSANFRFWNIVANEVAINYWRRFGNKIKIFLKEEEAVEYIKWNKPIFSRQDLLNFNMLCDSSNYVKYQEFIKEKLENIQ